MKMKRLTFLILLISLTVALFYSAVAGAQVVAECRVGSQAPAIGFWTWRAKSTVSVYVVNPDFGNDELTAVLLPFTNWNAVSERTGSFVKFNYRGTVTTPMFCENCLTVMRGNVFDKSKRHATVLRAFSAGGDQTLTWASIVVDHALTNPKVLTNAIAHELGHNFGLVDCYDCQPGTTVMIKLRTMDTPNGMEGPSQCDIAQVRAAYREIALRLRPELSKKVPEDEGEEPVDDDTPIVFKKP